MHKLNLRQRCLLLGAACLLVIGPVAAAQQTLAFEVVSVKQNITGQPATISDSKDGDGLSIKSMPLDQIIEYAYDIQNNNLLVGAPAWVTSTRFDIQARVSAPDFEAYHKLNVTQRKAMLKAILIDRFKIGVHHAAQEVSIYALVLAKKGPSKMTEVTPGEHRSTGIKNTDGTVNQGELLLSKTPGQLAGQEVPMDALAKGLSGIVGAQVVDNTGLTGVYDFKLEWQPGPGGAPAASSGSTSGPSIAAALEQQLGLKLEEEKVVLPVVVIDRIEQPSAS